MNREEYKKEIQTIQNTIFKHPNPNPFIVISDLLDLLDKLIDTIYLGE